MKKIDRRWLRGAVLGIVAIAAAAIWWALRPSGLPEGFASGNGRIEATEVDISAKSAGRITGIVAEEGAFVRAGETLASMDTQVLQAQRAQAEAQVRQAQNAVVTAHSVVVQRQSERAAAVATVAQRDSAVNAAQKRLRRTKGLASEGAAAAQELDDDNAQVQNARAALEAARAQVAAAQAGIDAARSQVIEAESAIEAARATVVRIDADIEDSALKSPRDGRVQYRVAQPGEVLAPGGRVLNIVDLNDVYMTFFLPTEAAGRVGVGAEVRIVLDAAPAYVIPAKATYVADVAQFTPKTVETSSERLKLMFRVKARIDPELLKAHLEQVKTGLPGMAYVRLDPAATWPDALQIKVPQ